MKSQKHLFDIPSNITYLNGAYMSPLLKTIAEAGYKGVDRKIRPWELSDTDFFKDRAVLKQKFATLIGASNASYTAIIPSVSYGIANAANNIDFKSGDEIILLDEQFPSNVYSWQQVAKTHNLLIKTIDAPPLQKGRGKIWNEWLLNAISSKTKVVALPQVHWADGTLFSLEAIREACDTNNALLIIDGTQSIGAYPFSVKNIQPDALICGGYKWMLGPYALGMAYYNEKFHHGNPIEENWMNRLHSENFKELTKYQEQYQPDAGRFNMGESSNFILVPMLIKAIEQLLEWSPEAIQTYCKKISKKAIDNLTESGCFIETATNRANHLFGIFLPQGSDFKNLKAKLLQEHIYVSYRGNAIRVSPNVYNTEEDLLKLSAVIKQHLP